MPRRPLRVIPCPVYGPDDPTPLGQDGCARCGHRVHDLRELDVHEARERLAALHGRVCVLAATRADGVLVFRRPRPRLVWSLGLTVLAACTPILTELETSVPTECRDRDGYEIVCEPSADPWAFSVPDRLPQEAPPAPEESLEPELETPAIEQDEEPRARSKERRTLGILIDDGADPLSGI